MKKERRRGAIVATAVVLLGSLAAVAGGFFPLVGPGAALFCVILGSVLTIFERTRQFAVGFLITSAILLFVTGGVCVALIASISSSSALGTA
jgi:hypothetical protein